MNLVHTVPKMVKKSKMVPGKSKKRSEKWAKKPKNAREMAYRPLKLVQHEWAKLFSRKDAVGWAEFDCRRLFLSASQFAEKSPELRMHLQFPRDHANNRPSPSAKIVKKMATVDDPAQRITASYHPKRLGVSLDEWEDSSFTLVGSSGERAVLSRRTADCPSVASFDSSSRLGSPS